MKKVGSTFEYEEARNKDLLRAINVQCDAHPYWSMPEIFKAVVDMPSERFWVSEERAAIVISNLFNGASLHKMGATKREMYLEIFRRVQELKKKRPKDSIYNLTFDVVNGTAPKFYLTPGSAKVILHKIKHGWYEERKHKSRRY